MGLKGSRSWCSCLFNHSEVKAVNISLGFFLVINYCLGSGYLGVPYAFFYSGYLAAIPTTIFIGAVSWVNANYLLEVMARAQVSGRQCKCNVYSYNVRYFAKKCFVDCLGQVRNTPQSQYYEGHHNQLWLLSPNPLYVQSVRVTIPIGWFMIVV